MLENMLDYVRILLYGLLLILGLFLYQAWLKDHPEPQVSVQTETVSNRFIPTTPKAPAATSPNASPVPNTHAVLAKGEILTVTTDFFAASIDTQGGDIIEVKLLKYPESLQSKKPIVLLNDDAKTRYIAESGLLSETGPDTRETKAKYTTNQSVYSLEPNQQTVTVPLFWENKSGVKVTKLFTFTRGSYEIKINYLINNHSPQIFNGNMYAQLLRTDTPPNAQSGMMNLTTFFGAAFSSPQKPFQKLAFKEMHDKSVDQTIVDGWAAMVQHYFISALIPSKESVSTYYSKAMPTGLYAIGLIGKDVNVAPNAQQSTEINLYVGPTLASELDKASPTLKLTIDYGWFWFISDIIFWMMQKIYNVVGNWGWAIVIVTIIIKLLFYHLSAKSYRSMSALKKLQPRMEMLKERFKDDKQKLTQATLELYKTEKVNPMSGCLPILIQIPVFIALYWVLVESVQLRQAPFILWIKDLSQADPYYILPLLMGLSMFLQQRLNPPPPDPLQARVMMLMPIIFTVLFINFPAGLMLYWFVNNTLSFLQQWHIMRNINYHANKTK